MDDVPVDAMAPWTIKSVPTATREAVTKAARQEGVTVGQWLEKRVNEWLTDGSPMPVSPGQAVVAQVSPGRADLADLRALAAMARELSPPDKDTVALRLARRVVSERLKRM